MMEFLGKSVALVALTTAFGAFAEIGVADFGKTRFMARRTGRLCTVATVPDGADELVLQLNARIGPGERLKYSDANIFKVME